MDAEAPCGWRSSVRYPVKGWIARGTSQGFPGRHRTATNQNFSGFVTGNRDYLKFVLSFHYAVYRRESVPKHVCFTRSGCAAALSPHPAVAGDSRALEEKGTLY